MPVKAHESDLLVAPRCHTCEQDECECPEQLTGQDAPDPGGRQDAGGPRVQAELGALRVVRDLAETAVLEHWRLYDSLPKALVELGDAVKAAKLLEE